MANLVLFVVERHDPRAVVLCFGAEAADYRTELFAPYHADRPPMPGELERQWADAPALLRRVRLARRCTRPTLEADDLLGSLAKIEAQAGGDGAALHRRPRHVPVRRRARARCCSRAAARTARRSSAPDEVRERYGIEPEQVPDFIALRGDPSDGLPGAKGIGAKTARATCCASTARSRASSPPARSPAR